MVATLFAVLSCPQVSTLDVTRKCLPTSLTTRNYSFQVATALGYIVHILLVISKYQEVCEDPSNCVKHSGHQVHLRYHLCYRASRSTVCVTRKVYSDTT